MDIDAYLTGGIVSKIFSFRCPDDLLEAIEAQAESRGLSQSQIAIETLRSGLKIFTAGTINEALQKLQERVSILEQNIARLNGEEVQLPPTETARSLEPQPDGLTCRHCSGTEFRREGQKWAQGHLYQRWYCKSCHHITFSEIEGAEPPIEKPKIEPELAIEPMPKNDEGVTCPHCSSTNLRRSGKRQYKNKPTKQVWVCNSCKRTFPKGPYHPQPKQKYW